MSGGRLSLRGIATIAVAAACSLAVVSSAAAATQVGETFVPVVAKSGLTSSVGLQSSSPNGQYTVPSAGVLTSWSFQAGPTPPPALKFKAARAGGGDVFTILGDSGQQAPVSNALNTFTDIRISVQPGDVIGFFVTPTGESARSAEPTYVVNGLGGDPPPGTTSTSAPPAFGVQLDVSAILEPDADNDGFGDETQDQCPTDAAVQGPCPVPETTITKRPKDKTRKKTATFEFSSSLPGSTFACSLDGGSFAPCISPDVLKVKKGKHSFDVRATANGQADPSPASDDWKVKKKRKRK